MIHFLNAWTCLCFPCWVNAKKNVFSTSVFLNATQPGIQTNFSLYSAARFDLLICCFLCRSDVSLAALTTNPDILFQGRLNLRLSWHSICDVHSGNTQQVPLWSWLAVKTSSPFNCLLPLDITLHPLTLDITTPQWVFWNCSGEKTRWWCLSLFGKFLHNFTFKLSH